MYRLLANEVYENRRLIDLLSPTGLGDTGEAVLTIVGLSPASAETT